MPQANGWKSQFAPEDLVRDDHWTELALDEWKGWDAAAWWTLQRCSDR